MELKTAAKCDHEESLPRMTSEKKLIDTLLNEGWIDGNSKPCPRCRVSIEGTCVNRLFEGITTSDGEDEDGDINWVQFIHNSDDETDSELEFFVEEEDA
ncbi:hypothetical protein NECAME_10278 [Necator americanus]|uniref:Uncharacterized protein n=1 Tax=Necator americanus TaxID=51031 RepID=W2TAC2_NECAM|nr:hypothetical protein NECAME_10278 [Necator americanus]ETN78544.1 hypothetical protein NECAME_10278 [Necator americanus]